MPSRIKILPDNLVNKIAAGEVVERPASVVKELIENAVDAGATEIIVEIEQSGKRLIRVTDNGGGMSGEDARTAFERHATSKISAEADLEAIRTMGFRGEALSSVAAVAQVTLLTAERGAPSGTLIEIEGGVVRKTAEAAARQGTSIEVNHLFFNTPARLKFLKTAATELSHIISAVSHQALSRPDIRFRLLHGKKPVLDLPESGRTSERIFQLYGEDLSQNLIEVSGERDPVRVTGLIARPNYDRADRTYQEFYVNGRFVRNPSLTHALYEAYRDLLMRDRHPAGFIFIEIDPAFVDVNVHPAKAEVRFRNQSQIHDLVRDVIREGLRKHGQSTAGEEQGAGIHARPAYADRVKESITVFEAHNSTFKIDEDLRHRSSQISHDYVFDPERQTPTAGLLFPLAQVHNSFIVAQSNDGMALIDQHAAHERILFEKLQDQYAAGNIPVQSLLIPVTVEVGSAGKELLVEHRSALSSLGFDVEPFGGMTFAIKAVPALMTGADYKGLLLDILDEVQSHGESRKMDELREEILSVLACHPAIKIHRKLSFPEMERLIIDLFACRMPHSCPHGRPTVARFSMDEIRKLFKRTG